MAKCSFRIRFGSISVLPWGFWATKEKNNILAEVVGSHSLYKGYFMLSTGSHHFSCIYQYLRNIFLNIPMRVRYNESGRTVMVLFFSTACLSVHFLLYYPISASLFYSPSGQKIQESIITRLWGKRRQSYPHKRCKEPIPPRCSSAKTEEHARHAF